MSIFQRLWGETPKSQFVAEYYQRLPFSRSGGARPVCELGQWETIDAVLADPAADIMVVRRGEQWSGGKPASGDEARRLVEQGYTLLARHAERYHAGLAELAASFRHDFAAPVDIHIFATPAQEFGFGWHYDAEEVFILQTTGRKEYALRKNTVHPWPLEETLPDDMGFQHEIMPMMKCMLSAGDWLYIPSGYWHRAKAEEMAISLAVGVMPRTAIDYYDSMRGTLIQSLLWRQRLPTHGAASPLSPDQLRATYREILQQLATDLHRTLADDRVLDQWLSRDRD